MPKPAKASAAAANNSTSVIWKRRCVTESNITSCSVCISGTGTSASTWCIAARKPAAMPRGSIAVRTRSEADDRGRCQIGTYMISTGSFVQAGAADVRRHADHFLQRVVMLHAASDRALVRPQTPRGPLRNDDHLAFALAVVERPAFAEWDAQRLEIVRTHEPHVHHRPLEHGSLVAFGGGHVDPRLALQRKRGDEAGREYAGERSRLLQHALEEGGLLRHLGVLGKWHRHVNG